MLCPSRNTQARRLCDYDILEVKKAIRSVRISAAEELAEQVLELRTVQEIKTCVEQHGHSAGNQFNTAS